MNKRGVTLLELLISISLISIVLLFLLKVMISLQNINNNKSYASSDEIRRTEIIKAIEEDFLNRKLNGVKIIENKNVTTLIFTFQDTSEEYLKIESNKITYKDTYTLKSENATYDLCPSYKYIELEDNLYYLKIIVPVLINGINPTIDDDISLTFLSVKNETTNYLENFTCTIK